MHRLRLCRSGASAFLALAAARCRLVRYKSPGPVIFRQKRVGRDGVLFTVFKFRTMAIDAQEDGPSLTKRGDPRVTRFGGFLRKYKLDELPQLVNVLRGDMSLVGPRPKLPHLEVMHMPFRPGLTGAATLAFRCEEEMLQDIPDEELEAYYCRMIKPLKAKSIGITCARPPWRAISLFSMRRPSAASPAAPIPGRLTFSKVRMSVSEQDVERVAELANLELTSSEKAGMLRDLNSVLDYFAQLNELDTSPCRPCRRLPTSWRGQKPEDSGGAFTCGRNRSILEAGSGFGVCLCSGYGRSLLQSAQGH
jgi:hypothetical protein